VRFEKRFSVLHLPVGRIPDSSLAQFGYLATAILQDLDRGCSDSRIFDGGAWTASNPLLQESEIRRWAGSVPPRGSGWVNDHHAILLLIFSPDVLPTRYREVVLARSKFDLRLLRQGYDEYGFQSMFLLRHSTDEIRVTTSSRNQVPRGLGPRSLEPVSRRQSNSTCYCFILDGAVPGLY
jgi:hypothetical protein